MDENSNRISVRMDPELVPVRLEDRRLELNEEIQVNVESRLTGLGMAGLVAVAVGVVAILGAAILFTFGYPEKYHAIEPVTLAESHTFIEQVVLVGAAGIILLFAGTSSFFYGRIVLGSGHLDKFSRSERLDEVR